MASQIYISTATPVSGFPENSQVFLSNIYRHPRMSTPVKQLLMVKRRYPDGNRDTWFISSSKWGFEQDGACCKVMTQSTLAIYNAAAWILASSWIQGMSVNCIIENWLIQVNCLTQYFDAVTTAGVEQDLIGKVDETRFTQRVPSCHESQAQKIWWQLVRHKDEC